MKIKVKFFDTQEGGWAADWMAVNGDRIVADNEGKELVEVIETDRFVPCLFTGHMDCNGAEIYEGHILKILTDHPADDFLVTVEWDEAGARFLARDDVGHLSELPFHTSGYTAGKGHRPVIDGHELEYV